MQVSYAYAYLFHHQQLVAFDLSFSLCWSNLISSHLLSSTMGRFPSGRRGGEIPGVLLFSSGQAPTKKLFNLTIPPVPPETYDAIASRIATFQPWLGKKAQLDKAQQKSQIYHENLLLAQDKLKELEEQREHVQEVRQTETQEALKELEESIQLDFDDELNDKENQWENEREELEKEIEEDLKRARSEMKLKQTKTEEGEQSEEPPQKRNKLEDDSEQPPRVSLDDDLEEHSEEPHTAPVAAAAAEETKSDLVAHVEAEEDEGESKLSFTKKQEVETFQKKADELAGMKINMSWLLKTIIKTENERKKKNDELKEKGSTLTGS